MGVAALWMLNTQEGTPRLELLQTSYNPKEHSFDITFTQHTLPTPDQPFKLPQVIPIKLGLIGKTSKQDLLPPFVVGSRQTSTLLPPSASALSRVTVECPES